jgi:hypothetical protein
MNRPCVQETHAQHRFLSLGEGRKERFPRRSAPISLLFALASAGVHTPRPQAHSCLGACVCRAGALIGKKMGASFRA